MHHLLGDLLYGVRMLRKSPGATLVAILSLALGIGATTTIFTVLNAVILRPPAFRDPAALVVVREQNLKENIRDFDASPANFRDWRERNRSFQALSAMRAAPATLTGSGQPERFEIARVSANFFDTLGISAIRGRTFLAGEDEPSRSNVAVLSYGLWQRRFGADPAIIDKQIVLDGESYTVAGIAAVQTRLFDATPELWIPYVLTPKELGDRGFHTLKVIGRLKPGASIAQASGEMAAVANQLASEHPDFNSNWGITLTGLQPYLTGGLRQPLWTIMGFVGIVLLIACGNVASILLMKAGVRYRELAIRTTLGASPYRILTQMLAESIVLALAAAVLGIALAWAGTLGLAAILPASITGMDGLAMDARVLAFAVIVAILTGLLFGLVPGLAVMRADLNATLRSSGRSGMSGTGWSRIRNALVVAEITLAQILLVGAGLLIHSLVNLRNVPAGFRTDHVVSMRVSLPPTRYKDFEIARFFERLAGRAAAIPGVQAAGVARDLPLSGVNPSLNFRIEGAPDKKPSEQPRAKFRSVNAGYFDALGIRVVRGRTFNASDSDQTPAVAVINESLANREWPGQDPIGRRIKSGFDGSPWCTIVGIAGDVKHGGLDAKPEAEVYYHYQQLAPKLMGFVQSTMTLVLRTAQDPAQVTGAVRREVAQLDPELAVYGVKTADDLVAMSVAQPRFRSVLLTIFAGAALLLSAIGLYGLVAASVVQRTNELGVRSALGATAGDLAGMVLKHGIALALAGIAAGLAVGFWIGRLFENLLFGVAVRDWVTFVTTPLILLVIVVAATIVPALRAAKIAPADALRTT